MTAPATSAPVSPHVAIICTAERLMLRDDVNNLYFNVNLSTAVVGDSSPWSFTTNSANQKLLEVWVNQFDPNQPATFDVFPITGGAIGTAVTATANRSPGQPSPAADFLTYQLTQVLIATDPSLVSWNPTNPSANTQDAASAYQPAAWRHLVAHASTWPRPIPQGLCLSFEVGVPAAAVSGVDSVLLFPRFLTDHVDLTPGNVQPVGTGKWISYRAQYTDTRNPRCAYQALCPVSPRQSGALFNPTTYWMQKDPAAATDSTSDWRQRVEALIANRFDYLPRLLGLVGALPKQAVWSLGLQMLRVMSDIGASQTLEGQSIQYALLLRAQEAVYGFPAKNATTPLQTLLNLIAAHPPDWTSELVTLLNSVNPTLKHQLATLSDSHNNDFSNAIPVIKNLYSVLSNDDNLATLLLQWWDDAINASGTTVPGDWQELKKALSQQVFPPAQLHGRYLSAIAANSTPLVGPGLLNALGSSFPGRSSHTAVLVPAGGMLVFGGYSATVPPAPAAPPLLQDAWGLGIAEQSVQPWMLVMPSGGPPTVRAAHSAVYDSNGNQMIVYGGLGTGGSLNDVWLLSTGANPAWIQINPALASGTTAPPSSRFGHSAAFDSSDPHNTRMIVFGGGVGSPPAGAADVWILTNASGTYSWSQLTVTGSAPAGRFYHSVVYDPGFNRLIVFGGISSVVGTLFNDVWILSNANGQGGSPSWTLLTPAGGPAAREGHTAIYDSSSNSMVVFGGTGATGLLSDTWVLSNANGLGGTPAWKQLQPTGAAISARSGHSAIYDVTSNAAGATTGRMIVFSGSGQIVTNQSGANQYVPDVWALSNPTVMGGTPAWTKLNPSGSPQLDSAVRASVAGWVHANAAAVVSPPAGFVSQVDALVSADVNDPTNGLTSVALDIPTTTQRPHSIVLQVGAWDGSDTPGDDPNEDLRRIAGVGVLIRKRDPATNAASPWRCLNAADVTVAYNNNSVQNTGLFVPTRLQYRNGLKDPYLAYDNQPLIARSSQVDLKGQFDGSMGSWEPNTPYTVGYIVLDSGNHRQECTTAGVSADTPPAQWNDAGGTTTDGTVVWTDQGLLNPSIAISYGLPTTGAYSQIYGLVFGVTYEFAPFAVGHGGAMPVAIDNPPGTINPNIAFEDYSVIRAVSYRRRVPVGHLRVVSPNVMAYGDWQPNLSAQWPTIPATVYPLARDLIQPDSSGEDLPLLLLQFQQPATPSAAATVATYNFNILPPSTDIYTWDRWVASGYFGANTTNTRKAVWAAFHKLNANTAGADSSDANTSSNRIGDPAVSAIQFHLDTYDIPSGAWLGAGDGWMAVQYTSNITGEPADWTAVWNAVWATPAAIKVVPVAQGVPCNMQQTGSAFIVNMPPANVARLTVTAMVSDADFTGRFETDVFAVDSDRGPDGKTYWPLGASYSMLIECPATTSISPAALTQSLSLQFDSARILTAALPNLRQMPTLTVGTFELHRQDWRWLGRPLPDLAGFPPPQWSTWDQGAFAGRPDDDYVVSLKRFAPQTDGSEVLATIDFSRDPRCQYIRFGVIGHNRYEDLPWFQPDLLPPTPNGTAWSRVCVDRATAPPKPPKPLVRAVVPLMQRTDASGDPLFDLLVIADETWYRIGGLGETLIGQIQPVIGTELTTISGPPYTYTVVGRFNGDAGVRYLDTGVAFTIMTPPTAAGQYSVDPSTKTYTFASADAGANVAISYYELDLQGQQLYEYGPDQIVTASPAASVTPPQITLQPMGATLDDPSVIAPSFTNTYFTATLSPSNLASLTSWNHFKIQFRRDLQAFNGSSVPVLSSDWTDAMWVQTVPDSATFSTSTGSIACGTIRAHWLSSGQVTLRDQNGATVTLAPTSTKFQFWYVVTQSITDAFGNPAEVYIRPQDGTNQYAPVAGATYNLRIVEVQLSASQLPAAAALQFDDSNFLNTRSWTPTCAYQLGQIIIDTNNNIQQVTTPGTSGQAAPLKWATLPNQTTPNDGTVIWMNRGPWHGDEMLRIVRISPPILLS
jgi:hypothetical protein